MAAAIPPQSLKERQRQEREELILQTAEALLLEKGYHETSMEEIASRVGISKGTVYLHFASKEDMMFALLERGMRSFLRSLDAILAATVTPHMKLQRIIEHIYGNMGGKHLQLLSAMFHSPDFRSHLMESWQSQKHALWEEPMKRMAAVLDEGKATGEFDTALPTPVLVSLLGSLLTPQSYHRLVIRQGMPLDEVVRHVSRFFFKGIAATGADGSLCESPRGNDIPAWEGNLTRNA